MVRVNQFQEGETMFRGRKKKQLGLKWVQIMDTNHGYNFLRCTIKAPTINSKYLIYFYVKHYKKWFILLSS